MTKDGRPDKTDFQNISNAISCVVDFEYRKLVADEVGQIAVNCISISWDEWYKWCGVKRNV